MQDSIFTKIIRGEIPCYKIYEDASTFAFLDIHPIQPGHVLVVPKKQVDFVWDLNPEDYQALMATVKKIALRLREVFPDKARIGMMVQGLDVANHAHIKVFPFSTAADYYHQPAMDDEPNRSELAAIAQQLQMEDEV